MKAPTNKEIADAFRLMCRFSMSVCIEADGKEAVAVFYGGLIAREPCANGREAVPAAIRAINRCAVLAADACGVTVDRYQCLSQQTPMPSPMDSESEG